MKSKFPFLLSCMALFLAVILMTAFLAFRNLAAIDIYWGLLYFLPGLLFSLLVMIIKAAKPTWVNALFFLVISTLLYMLTFFGSIIGGCISFIVAPSLSALAFIALIQAFLKIKFSVPVKLMALLAGLISGGITLYTERWGDEYAQILYLPIVLWWIYMAVLIDVATLQKKAHV